MITLNNIVTHELIGLKTEVVESTDQHIMGLSGKIVDETKSMFLIKTQSGLKNIPKNSNKWKFHINGQNITLSGSLIQKRPEDRLRLKI